MTPLPEDMQAVFHDPSTGEPWVEGDVYFRNDLADTLEELAKVRLEGTTRGGPGRDKSKAGGAWGGLVRFSSRSSM